MQMQRCEGGEEKSEVGRRKKVEVKKVLSETKRVCSHGDRCGG